MRRRLYTLAFAAFVIGFVGCDKGPVSTNKDMPTKGAQVIDKKTGKESRAMDATLELK